MILILGSTGMFGSRVLRQTLALGAPVRALVHSPSHVPSVKALGVDVVVGDLDDPDSLAAAFAGIETVFLVTPMAPGVLARETNALAAAKDAGVNRIVKLFGAVKHLQSEELHSEHLESIANISKSGLRWSLVSPNSAMETSLLDQAAGIVAANMLFGCAGDGKIGLVAADDVARAAAVVLTNRDEQGENYQLTGPASLSLTGVAAEFTTALGREVTYQDMPEQAFRSMMVSDVGIPDDVVDNALMVHFAAWKRGGADMVTDTYQKLTGNPPTTLEQWIVANKQPFEANATA